MKCAVIITVVIFGVCLVPGGCQREARNGSTADRQALIERLQREYPATWRQELQEHDEAMERIESARPAPEYGPGYAPDPEKPNYQRSPWAFPEVRANP